MAFFATRGWSRSTRGRTAAARIAVILILGTVLVGTSGQAQTSMDLQRVKAAFIVNFLSFVTWSGGKHGPPGGAPFRVAVLGDPRLAELIAEISRGRDVAGHAVSVRAVQEGEDPPSAHLLFVGASEARRLPAIVRMAAEAGTLTVGDTEGFARDGVAINLYTFDNRIHIEVNSAAVNRAGLRLSANLLRLARVVE